MRTRKPSTRTLNRLKENPDMVPVRSARFVGGGPLSGRDCVLFRDIITGWSGWLPADELPTPNQGDQTCC